MPQPEFPVWPFRPNWSNNVVETLSWMTDILTSQTGVEQRRALRENPRKEIEYTSLLTQRERAKHDNALSSEGEHDFMLPLWHDQHYLEDDVLPGATLLNMTTARDGEFVASGWLMLAYEKPQFTYEVVQIRNVGSFGIELIDPLQRPWDKGSKLYPLQRARFTDPPQLARLSDATVRGSYRFAVTDPDPRNFLPDDAVRLGLITAGLVSRMFTPTDDGSGFDKAAGITVGQASMAIALARASAALTFDQTLRGRQSSAFYKATALSVLDAVVGQESRFGAILRQTVPTAPGKPCIPHWLYAARGDVAGLAGIGEGYEFVPAPSKLPGGFASADPACFRDLDRALAWAIFNDGRPGKPEQWNQLREGLRRANLSGRQISDGRVILAPLPDLEVAPVTGQPDQMFVTTQVPVQEADSFYYRDPLNGDILLNIPNSVEAVVTTSTTPTSTSTATNPQYTTTETITPTPVLRYTFVGRGIIEFWRDAQAYQTPDQYMFVQLLLSRPLDTSKFEQAVIGLVTEDGTTYLADITGNSLEQESGGNVKTLLIPRESFIRGGGGPILPVGARIVQFYVRIAAINAFVMRVRSARILSGPSAEAVTGNIDAALRGDPLPFLPGTSPYRISGYGEKGVFIGFNGDPASIAQTPDLWSDFNDRISDLIPGVTASTLPSIDAGSRAITYPYAESTTTGFPKPPAVLLAEQNLDFLKKSQDSYQAATGVNGPFRHTFTLNRSDRFYNVGAEPHTWVDRNIATEFDIVFQWRAAESVARLICDTYTTSLSVLYEGGHVLYGGKRVHAGRGGPEVPIGYPNAKYWIDNATAGKEILDRFVSWFLTTWDRTLPVFAGRIPLVYNGAQIVAFVSPNNGTAALHKTTVIDPAFGVDTYGINPAALALMMRTCLFSRKLSPNSGLYINGLNYGWKYLKAYYHTTGELSFMWTKDYGRINWYYSEILLTLSTMLERKELLTPEIDAEDVRLMLVNTRTWLETYGVAVTGGNYVGGLGMIYKDYYVLTTAPNEARSMSIDFQRLTEDFDNEVSIPIRSEYDPSPFHRPQYAWWINGRSEDRRFRQMLYSMRGRAVPIWMPTFMADFVPIDSLIANTKTLKVENVGYTISGGPRRTREHVVFFMRDGSYLFRQIVGSSEDNEHVETLTFDLPFYDNNTYDEIVRISFMDLMRLDQDGIQIAHDNAVDGVAQSTTVFRSVKDTRRPING